MLDRSALSQLKGLKNQMEAEKERAEGVVRGTTARYGFARLDDGREVFLPPDEMLKAFPGDRVKVCIRSGKDGRPVADIEGLVSSAVQDFTGECVTKGKAVFVRPDLPDLARWLFLPPHAREGAQSGDYLRCSLLKHPVRDGKPQAKVVERVGTADTPGIENKYTIAKHGLQTAWPEAQASELEALLEAEDPTADPNREDFSDLEFVTIDAARTQDIDDALYAEVTSEGWVLYVAIADPTAYIKADSPLRDIIRDRASSVYFHGTVLPMLPESIAQQHCALSENDLRPALVCRVSVSETGEVGDYRFFEANIRSRAKLSYYAVDRYLSGQDEALICHATPLEALFQVSRALRSRREARELVMEDRQEFRWILNESGHIDHIEPAEKLLSQRLVEECMVAANRCAARLLADAKASGPFVVHDGFRKDRAKDRAKFLQRYLPESDLDPDTLEGYRNLIKLLTVSNHEMPLRSMVNRLLTRARFSRKPGEHKGMSLPLYANCTSPLRKYLDFLTHLQIKSVLRNEEAQNCDQQELELLNQRLLRLRQVSFEAERWLALEYLQRLVQEDNAYWRGQISHITNEGFMVRLEDNGLEGYVNLQNSKENFNFEKLTASLRSKKREFRVEMTVKVKLAGVDDSKPHLAAFRLDPESGLKQTGKKGTDQSPKPHPKQHPKQHPKPQATAESAPSPDLKPEQERQQTPEQEPVQTTETIDNATNDSAPESAQGGELNSETLAAPSASPPDATVSATAASEQKPSTPS